MTVSLNMKVAETPYYKKNISVLKQNRCFAKNSTFSKTSDCKLSNVFYYPISFGSGEDFDLNISKVTNSINKQLDIIEIKDIKEIIDSFNEEDRLIALKTAKKLTQFANMNSLNILAEYAGKNCYYDKDLFYQGNLINMSSVMNYLIEKKLFNMPWGSTRGKTSDKFYFLDEISLEELENNSSHLEEIKLNEKIKIIYPEGWINGINPFTQNRNLGDKIRAVIPEIKKIKQNTRVTDEEAITMAINKEIEKKIEKMGLSDRFTIIKNEGITSKPNTIEQITQQLAPPSLDKEYLNKIITELPQEQKKIALKFLEKTTRVYSPLSLTKKLKKMHDNFIEKGIIDAKGEDHTYYYVPNLKKSFGLISMMYSLANNIPSNKFFSLRENLPKDSEKIIILDDLAASGETFTREQFYNLKIINETKPQQIIIAPVLSTKYAYAEVNRGLVENNNKFNCKSLTYMPEEYIRSFEDNSIQEFFEENEINILKDVAGVLGVRNMGLNVAMPYMSPDNNNNFFRKNFAHKFTLNGKGVK